MAGSCVQAVSFMAMLDTQGPFSLYLFSWKRSTISILEVENVSDTAGGDKGLTGFFFSFSFFDIAERPGVVS